MQTKEMKKLNLSEFFMKLFNIKHIFSITIFLFSSHTTKRKSGHICPPVLTYTFFYERLLIFSFFSQKAFRNALFYELLELRRHERFVF